APRIRKNGERPSSSEDVAFAPPLSLSGAVKPGELMMPSLMSPPEIWRESWRPLLAMQSEMARWFDDVWREATSGRTFPNPMRVPFAELPVAGFAGLPRADFRETDKDYRLHVELPGMKLSDVQLEVDGDMLLVRGTKSDGSTSDTVNHHITERRFGRIERR